ncbi:MAG: hypothetical protein M0Z63_02720, partial [Actinomycetota bacterium]|nr:hypothetical protein [Actinomycetota bacterium]
SWCNAGSTLFDRVNPNAVRVNKRKTAATTAPPACSSPEAIPAGLLLDHVAFLLRWVEHERRSTNGVRAPNGSRISSRHRSAHGKQRELRHRSERMQDRLTMDRRDRP